MDQPHRHTAIFGQTVLPSTYHTGYSQAPGWSSLVDHPVPLSPNLGLDCIGNSLAFLQNGGLPNAYSLAPWVYPEIHSPGSFFARRPEDTVNQPGLTNFSYPEEGYPAMDVPWAQEEFGYPTVVPGDHDGSTYTLDAQDSSDEGSVPL